MDAISEILTWTLIHSFWIALITWAISQGVSFLIKKSAFRLLIKGLLLVAFFIGTVQIAWLQLPKMGDPDIIWAFFEDQIFLDQQLSWIDFFKLTINENSLWISLFWIIGCSVGSIQIVQHKRVLTRIALTSSPVSTDSIQAVLADIKKRLQIKTEVRLLVNDLILSPMTTGFLKPVIFIPAGIITGFNQEELEAILYHELAHIKRKDYLINLFLVGFETIFFFNPLVKLMVKDIRNEMEYACDDVVLKNQNEITYARTLLKLQEFNLNNRLALNLKGSQSEFSKRIHRMIEHNKPISHHRILVSTCLLLVFLLSSAFVSQKRPESPLVAENGQLLGQEPIESDTMRFNSKDDLIEKIRSIDPAHMKGKVFYLNGQKVNIIRDANNALKKADRMMEEIQEELIKDGILNSNRQKITLMFQYSDLLQGEKTLGIHYNKYKSIFNRYFPVYDSFATTRVFRFK